MKTCYKGHYPNAFETLTGTGHEADSGGRHCPECRNMHSRICSWHLKALRTAEPPMAGIAAPGGTDLPVTPAGSARLSAPCQVRPRRPS